MQKILVKAISWMIVGAVVTTSLRLTSETLNYVTNKLDPTAN